MAASELDPLPIPVADGAAALLLDDGRANLPAIDWRLSLLSLFTHLLFAALLFALAYWMGKPPPEEPPAIEVSLAPDPQPPAPPPPPRETPRPQPPPPPPALPRASEASSLGEGAPQTTKENDTPTASPAESAIAPRADQPQPAAKPVEKPQQAAEAPPAPQRPIETPTPLTSETEAQAVPAPPILATPQSKSASRPAPPRAAPPPSLALRKVPETAPAPPAEIRPQRKSLDSAAPPPSPHGITAQASGHMAAVEDPYLKALADQMSAHASLLGPYFNSSPRSEVQLHIWIDQAGRVRKHEFVVSSLYANLDYTIEKMLALATPFPPPPADLLAQGDPVGVTVFIPLPTKEAAWREMYH